jgi:serine/threonine protein kinase
LSAVVTRWREGETPDVQGLLADHPEFRGDKRVLLDLLYEEVCLREERGDSPRVEEYIEEFPEYTASLRRLFETHEILYANPHLLGESADTELPIVGEDFLNFRLDAELGRGAFARVFLARERTLANRRVVLKVAQHGTAEAETLSRLAHPHVVPVLSAHIEPHTGRTGVCMPYLGIATLEDVLDRAFGNGRMPASASVILQAAAATSIDYEPPESVEPPDRLLQTASYGEGVIHLGVQLAEALAYMHRKGICHLDLKPSNVLLTPSGKPMLLDFNLSQDQELELHMVGGTLPYMSPEQLEATAGREPAELDARSDVFSLGVILYELLTGSVPFSPLPGHGPASALRDELRALHRAGPPPLRNRSTQVDSRLAGVVEKCLRFDPAERYSSAAELAQALARCLTFGQRTHRWVRRHSVGVLLAAVCLLTMAVSGGYALASRDSQSMRLLEQGRSASRNGDFLHAIDCLVKAAADDPDLAEAHLELGRVYLKLGNFQFARVALGQYIDKEPDDAEARAQLGYCCARTKEWRASYCHLTRAIELGDNSPVTRFNLAYCLAQKGEFAKAGALLRELRTIPEVANRAHRALIETQLSWQRAAPGGTAPQLDHERMNDLELAVQAAPGDSDARILVATVYGLVGQHHQQPTIWDEAIYNHLGHISRQQGGARLLLEGGVFERVTRQPRFAQMQITLTPEPTQGRFTDWLAAPD